MGETPVEDGLVVVSDNDDNVEDEFSEGAPEDGPWDLELAGLRDDFVDAFNGRDLEGLLALVSDDVDCPDLPGDGVDVLTDELRAVFERSPGAILTVGSFEDRACAVAWLPDEDGCWSRAALVCFDAADGLLTLVAMPDDADALDRTESAEPLGDELDEWVDWAEWDRGEETHPSARHREH